MRYKENFKKGMVRLIILLYLFTYGIRHNCLYSAILNPCTLSRLPPPCYLRVETLIPLHQCLMIDTGCSTDLICGHTMLDP